MTASGHHPLSDPSMRLARPGETAAPTLNSNAFSKTIVGNQAETEKFIRQLEQELNNEHTDSERVAILVSLARNALQVNRLHDARRYVSAAYDLARNIGDKSGEAEACNTFGLLYGRVGRYDEELDYHLRSLRLYQEVGNVARHAEALSCAGQVYGKCGDGDLALEYFRRALELLPTSRTALNNMAMILTIRKEYGKALDAYQRALTLSEGCLPLQLVVLNNMSVVYQQTDRLDDAYACLQKAIDLAGPNQLAELISIYQNLGSCYIRSENLEKAKDSFQKSYELGEIVGDRLGESRNSLHFSQLHAAGQDYKKAYESLVEHLTQREQMFNERLISRIADIAALYESEKRELEARQLVEKASRLASIGVMAAGITHEINQPLCSIKVNADGFLYWLRKNDLQLPNHLKDNLEQITDAASRIDTIIQHIRSFWTMPDHTQSAEIDLNTAVRQALTLVERQVFSHGIVLDLQLLDMSLKITADQVPVEEIVINLVVNAIQALDGVKRKDKKIAIITGQNDTWVTLQIVDNGPGIEEAVIPKLFDPFYSKKEVGTGMGLGLAIVKAYADQFHAGVEVTNRAEGGACFTLTFPRTDLEIE